jgi:hypothetical protein
MKDARMLGTFLGLAAHIRDLTEIKGSLEAHDFESVARRMIELYTEYEKQRNEETTNA